MLRGLFEGAQYNSEAGATHAVNLREQTKQGQGEIKEIQYVAILCIFFSCFCSLKDKESDR